MRINQHSSFLQDVMNSVRRGDLMPAAFQRPYVWSRHDVEQLVESILGGIPIGSFLVWSPSSNIDRAKAGTSRLGPIKANSISAHASMLLDGQNRLASLAWMSCPDKATWPTDMTEHEKAVWCEDELVLDLRAKKVMFVPAAQATLDFRLPVAAAFGRELMVEFMLAAMSGKGRWAHVSEADRDEGLKWYDHVLSTFMSARVVVTDLEQATPLEARDAFLRICRVGVPMTSVDFDKSMAWAY